MIGKLFFPTLTQESREPRWGRGWSKSTMPAYLDANIRFCIARSKYMTEHYCYLILNLRSVENVHDFCFKMYNFSHIEHVDKKVHVPTPSPPLSSLVSVCIHEHCTVAEILAFGRETGFSTQTLQRWYMYKSPQEIEANLANVFQSCC